MIRSPKTLFQPCNEANMGVGTEPKAGCPDCLGRGFYYFMDWAQTCHCKRRASTLT
jgi:hypothetical protein